MTMEDLISTRSIAGTSDGSGERSTNEVKWVKEFQLVEGQRPSFEVPVLAKNSKKEILGDGEEF